MSFKDLTKDQVKLISNGCGARKFLKPPEIKEFTASCDHHDYLYLRGGNLRDKIKADLLFKAHLLIDVADIKSPFKLFFYNGLINIYFKMVFLFGHFSFFYTRQKRTDQEILKRFKQ